MMVTCVRSEDEGLVILPTHRFLFGIERLVIESFLEQARERFDVHEMPKGLVDSELTKPGPRLFAYARSTQRMYGIVPRPGRLSHLAMPEELRCEPVVCLHHVLFPMLQLPLAPEAGEKFKYVRPQEFATEAATRSQCELAFLLPPVAISSVLVSSREGFFLPPKSTFFYPKCMDGLTLYRFADAPSP
jgi:uncharacterized protein (DUF1015 family)